MDDNPSVFGSLRGIVQTLEQKSGLNPLLFVDTIFGIPGIVGYAWTGRSVLLAFAWIPLAVTLLFYGLAFFVDRNFLRSEKHIQEMRHLDLLGEKSKIVDERQVLDVPAIADPSAAKGTRGKKNG